MLNDNKPSSYHHIHIAFQQTLETMEIEREVKKQPI